MKNLQIENPKLAAKGLSIKKSYIQKVIYILQNLESSFHYYIVKRINLFIVKECPKSFMKKCYLYF